MRWPFPVTWVAQISHGEGALRKEQMKSSHLKRRKTIFAASNEAYIAQN
jgi:hypothetical protein